MAVPSRAADRGGWETRSAALGAVCRQQMRPACAAATAPLAASLGSWASRESPFGIAFATYTACLGQSARTVAILNLGQVCIKLHGLV